MFFVCMCSHKKLSSKKERDGALQGHAGSPRERERQEEGVAVEKGEVERGEVEECREVESTDGS